MLSILEYQNYNLFLLLVEKVKHRFGGVITREVNGPVPISQECLLMMEIHGKSIHFYWAWHGIDLSTSDPNAYRLLDEIADYLEGIRFNRFWLWFMEKTCGGT
jgi:hypothetical protein